MPYEFVLYVPYGLRLISLISQKGKLFYILSVEKKLFNLSLPYYYRCCWVQSCPHPWLTGYLREWRYGNRQQHGFVIL
jgi:hypothetical protein